MKTGKKYSIEQFPKNKKIETDHLSEHQNFIRKNQKRKKSSEAKICKKCLFELSIEEFYIKDKKTGRRASCCRDCTLKQMGVIELGKRRFSKKLHEKGFRRCTICINIKPFSEYRINSTEGYAGYDFECKACGKERNTKYVQNQRTEVGAFYIRQIGLKRGIKELSDFEKAKLKTEIAEKRIPRLFMDNHEFVSISQFSKYLKKHYNVPETTTKSRIQAGATELECLISEKEYRSFRNGRNKGLIKVTDTVTGEIFIFANTRSAELLKMFSSSFITKAIKTGNPTSTSKKCKYKNSCIIERLSAYN